MLYDPKWEVETKADPFDLSTLIAWLEKQPAHESYCYLDSEHCLLGRYFMDAGYRRIKVLGFTASLDGDEILLSRDFQDIPAMRPHTFGDALARAKAMQR